MTKKQTKKSRQPQFSPGDTVRVKASGEIGVIDHILEHPMRRLGSGLWVAGLKKADGEFNYRKPEFKRGVSGFDNAFMFWELERMETS